MESLLPIIIQSLVGGGGGWLGSMLKKNGLGLLGNVLSGAVGGNALSYILPMVMGGMADGGASSIAGIVTSLIGGGLGSVIGGLFKKA